MTLRSPLMRLTLFALANAVLPAAAWAQETPVPPPAAPAAFSAEAVSDELLGTIAGREDGEQAAFSNQTAGVANNSVGDNVRTGDAKIDGNAFQNMSGLSLLNVNTGNNVAINAAMNVTIAISPAQ